MYGAASSVSLAMECLAAGTSPPLAQGKSVPQVAVGVAAGVAALAPSLKMVFSQRLWQMTVAMKDMGIESRPLRNIRNSRQRLAPAEQKSAANGSYELYPAFPVTAGSVESGFDALAAHMAGHQCVRIDGFVGILWDDFHDRLEVALQAMGIDPTWKSVASAEKDSEQVAELVSPFLDNADPVFGNRFPGELTDFFDHEKLAALQPDSTAGLTILYGCGAGLAKWDGPLVYVDLPKNELQYRSRAGAVKNLGSREIDSPKVQYKRFYFVDWPILNGHKAAIAGRVDWFVDGQRPDQPTFISGGELRNALDRMSRNVFRVRPWFESGPWGGTWLKNHVAELPQDVPNYAWSFELITPENGIIFGDGSQLIELSFDWLMYLDHRAVLGDSADRFGFDFPVRFNFLDTFEGGNLSVQCHPRTDYVRREFGESFTQDEAYYIVDCKLGSEVYLGFVQNVDSTGFRAALERSYQKGTEVNVKQFVRTEPAHKHDFFLIPSGTIHCSGANILVLEISATPYLFTFKMYDWLRMNLDGEPRPLHIDRAFDNLCWDRQGDRVAQELISRPQILEESADRRLIHLPTHEEHFYDVMRHEFINEVYCQTNGSPHVLMLVEGSSLIVETANGMRMHFNLAETFVVPAAAESYKLINGGDGWAKVVVAFLKPPRIVKE
jgi:mannose-6-phosphate isomerase class I